MKRDIFRRTYAGYETANEIVISRYTRYEYKH